MDGSQPSLRLLAFVSERERMMSVVARSSAGISITVSPLSTLRSAMLSISSSPLFNGRGAR